MQAGGRVYLSKDIRLRRDHLGEMYPDLDAFRSLRERIDPAGVLRSDLGVRLGLCEGTGVSGGDRPRAGRRILLLGGTSEIGLAIVRELNARLPREVALAGRDQAALQQAADGLTREPDAHG